MDAKTKELLEAAKLLLQPSGTGMKGHMVFLDRRERLAAAVRDFEASETAGGTDTQRIVTTLTCSKCGGTSFHGDMQCIKCDPPKPMAEQDALNKARRLWGPRGGIFDRKNDPSSSYPKRFWVGCEAIRDYHGQHLYGNGNTWEEAFADAAQMQEKMVRGL